MRTWGSLLWGLELSQRCENTVGIIVLRFMSHPPGSPVEELMVTSFKKTGHAPPSQDCSWQSLCLRSRPLLTHTSSGDPQTLRGGSGSVSCGGHRSFPSVLAHRVLFVPSKCLWQLQGLILNVIVTLLPSYFSFHFALGHPTWGSGIGTEYPQAI